MKARARTRAESRPLREYGKLIDAVEPLVDLLAVSDWGRPGETMKTEWRIIVSGNSGDGFHYRLEEVIDQEEIDRHYNNWGERLSPFIKRDDKLSGSSPEELKERLEEMLKAFKKKKLYLTHPVVKEWE